MDVVYVPWGTGIDKMIGYGAAWLHKQSGDKLVLMTAKAVYQHNALLPRLTAGAKVATPSTVWKVDWRGGPVLAPWPSDKVLSTISDNVAERVTGVCVLPWGEDAYAEAWLAAHNATNLLTGQPQAPRDELLHPVVTMAMEYLTNTVNHANGLAGSDRDRVIGALLALVHAGYRFDVDALIAWALANGFTGSEVERLRDYATKALAGHRFRIRGFGALRADIVAVWERKARERGLDFTEPDGGLRSSRDS